jgi:hypothetical protein
MKMERGKERSNLELRHMARRQGDPFLFFFSRSSLNEPSS